MFKQDKIRSLTQTQTNRPAEVMFSLQKSFSPLTLVTSKTAPVDTNSFHTKENIGSPSAATMTDVEVQQGLSTLFSYTVYL